MVADNIVICSGSRKQVEGVRKRWRDAWEKRVEVIKVEDEFK